MIPKLETFQTERPGWVVEYLVRRGSPQVTVRNERRSILYRTMTHSREQALDAAKLYLKSRGVGFEWSA